MREPCYRRATEEAYRPLSQLTRHELAEIAAGLFQVSDEDEHDDGATDADFCRRYAARLLREMSG